mmetsp:Transcript_63631/g.168558  ORF Transcript_63631/g.168558 Transcript_63631/m.168558 type:complete len:470 (-) Transcript_63631:209-1618(-)
MFVWSAFEFLSYLVSLFSVEIFICVSFFLVGFNFSVLSRKQVKPTVTKKFFCEEETMPTALAQKPSSVNAEDVRKIHKTRFDSSRDCDQVLSCPGLETMSQSDVEARRLSLLIVRLVQDNSSESARRALNLHVLYREVQSRCAQLVPASTLPLHTYRSLLRSAVRFDMHNAIEDLLQGMEDGGTVRSLVLYEEIMKLLASRRRHKMALKVFDRAVKDGITPTAITCSCLISLAFDSGEMERAVGFFEQLKLLTTPSIRACMAVLKVYSVTLRWAEALQILKDMRLWRVNVDTLVLNVVLGTCISCAKLDEVEILVNEAEVMEQPPPDIVTYNILLKGYTKRHKSLEALNVIRRMHARSLTPNVITINAALEAAFRRPSGYDGAWALVKSTLETSLKLNNATAALVVRAFVKAQSPETFDLCLRVLSRTFDSKDQLFFDQLYNTLINTLSDPHDAAPLSVIQKHWAIRKR